MLLRPLLFAILFFSTTLAACIRKTRVLVPLYSYSQDCWPELQEAAKAHPSISWILILNPSSGPVVDPFEPALYCVPKLRQVMGKDLILIGYVRTGYNEGSLNEIRADVEIYASWKGIEVEGGTAGVDGIFFDETSDSTSERLEDCKKFAVESFGDKCVKIVTNPGTHVGEEYFKSASFVVDYESAFDTYDISNLPTNKKQLGKSIIMIHSLPSSNSLTDVLEPLVKEKKVGGVFVTDLKLEEEDVYSKFGGNWKEFVKGVEELND